LKLVRRAFSGSGTEVKGPHVMDPGSGQPAARRQAWAAAPRAAEADALSTAFLVMAKSRIRELLGHHPHLEAWLETPDGAVLPIRTA
jgi:thiamine biosynthesis lipoprotein ApbE